MLISACLNHHSLTSDSVELLKGLSKMKMQSLLHLLQTGLLASYCSATSFLGLKTRKTPLDDVS